MELSDRVHTWHPEVLVPHRNAASPRPALELALVVEDGWPVHRAAERFQVSWPTTRRWAQCYRQHHPVGMDDHSPHPHQTPPAVVQQVTALRADRGWRPARTGPRPGLPISTVLRGRQDPATREARRARAVSTCLTDDVCADKSATTSTPPQAIWCTSTSRSSDASPGGGGGHVHGRSARPNMEQGQSYGRLHTGLDDRSRLAHTEILTDEQGQTTAGFGMRAAAWSAGLDTTIARCLSAYGSDYRSRVSAAASAATGTVHQRTRSYGPQSNGEVERLHRTLPTERAYA